MGKISYEDKMRIQNLSWDIKQSLENFWERVENLAL